MATLFQPHSTFIIASVVVMFAGGCQTGIGRYMPSFGKESEPFARANQQRVSAADLNLPAPKVTERNYAQVQLAIGDSLAKEGNFEAAQAAYEAALRNDNSLARAYHRLALIHEKAGRGSESKDLFLRALELDPKNAEIICDYGYWCYLRQDWKESQKQFERALKLDPALKRAHNNLGLVYARTERPDEALRQFTLAGLTAADARANLGFVYLTQQRIPEATIELEQAVAATPSSEKAQHVLASLKKVETTDQPKRLPTITAAAATARLPIKHQFNVDVTPAVETPPHVAIASKPAVGPSTERPTNMSDLPTQTVSPVLAHYPFWETDSEPASVVELTEYADRQPAASTETTPNTPSHSGPRSIRFLPPLTDPPQGTSTNAPAVSRQEQI